MKFAKYFFSGFIMMSASLNVAADECSWSTNSLSGGGSQMNVGFKCTINGQEAAVKTVGAKAVGSQTCQINVNNGFVNNGTCTTPNISSSDLGGLPSGTKVCEFGDPSIGTTPGCTKSSVGGGGGTIAYSISKNGQYLMTVAVNSSYCSVSGTSASYTVSGNCNNYRIYVK